MNSRGDNMILHITEQPPPVCVKFCQIEVTSLMKMMKNSYYYIISLLLWLGCDNPQKTSLGYPFCHLTCNWVPIRTVVHNLFRTRATFLYLKLFGGQTNRPTTTKPYVRWMHVKTLQRMRMTYAIKNIVNIRSSSERDSNKPTSILQYTASF